MAVAYFGAMGARVREDYACTPENTDQCGSRATEDGEEPVDKIRMSPFLCSDFR